MPFTPSAANADVRALADLFAAATIGEVVSYDDMSAIIGASIKARRYLVPKALALANKESGALFALVIGHGQKRLPAEEANLLGHATRRHIRRASRRTAAMIGNGIDRANDMPADAKRKAYAELNVLGLIEHLSRDRVSTKAAQQHDRPVPVAQMMRSTLQQLGADLPAA